MAYEDYRRRIENMQSHLKRERTGDASEFAHKIGVSRRTLFYYLETMRDEGIEIKFCRFRKTYYYV